MSHSSYTASERRGILAIALVALLIIAIGVGFSFFNQSNNRTEESPKVIEHSEWKDTTDNSVVPVRKNKKEAGKKKNTKSGSKTKKTYRRRSPLDEPVS